MPDKLAIKKVAPTFLAIIQVGNKVTGAHSFRVNPPVLFDSGGLVVGGLPIGADVRVGLKVVEIGGVTDGAEGFLFCFIVVVERLVNEPEVCQHL